MPPDIELLAELSLDSWLLARSTHDAHRSQSTGAPGSEPLAICCGVRNCRTANARA